MKFCDILFLFTCALAGAATPSPGSANSLLPSSSYDMNYGQPSELPEHKGGGGGGHGGGEGGSSGGSSGSGSDSGGGSGSSGSSSSSGGSGAGARGSSTGGGSRMSNGVLSLSLVSVGLATVAIRALFL